MAGPLLGMLEQGQRRDVRHPGRLRRSAALAGEVLTASDIGLPLGPAGKAALVPANVAEFAEGLDVERERRAALPRAARGRPPAAVRPRAVAARAPDRRGRRLRPRHRDRRQSGDRGADARHRPDQPRRDAGGPRRAGCSSPSRPPAQQAALHPARGHPRAGRGLGRRGGRPGHRRADADRRPSCRRRSAAAAPPAGRPSRPSPRWSASSCGRAGCATPPRCGARCAPARAPRPATACGCTPTCCRPPPTSTTRWASARTPSAPGRAHRRRVRRRAAATCSRAGSARRRTTRPRPERARDVTPARRRARRTARAGHAPTPGQDALRERYVAHLAAHPDGMTARLLPRPPHRRARWCCRPTGRRVLLTLHAKAGEWFQLGGHCEPERHHAGRRRAARGGSRSPASTGLRARPGAAAARRARGAVLRPARAACTTSTCGSSPSRRRTPSTAVSDGVAGRALVAGRRAARAEPDAWDELIALARARDQSTADTGSAPRLGPRRRPRRGRLEVGGRGPAEQVALGALGLRVAVHPAPRTAGSWPGSSRWASSWTST